MATVNVELSDSAYERLTQMAQEQKVPHSVVIEDLLDHSFFELTKQQMQEVDLAIEALDRGEVASEEEAQAFFAKYAR